MGHLLVEVDFSFSLVMPGHRDNQTHVYIAVRKRGRRWVLDFSTVDPT